MKWRMRCSYHKPKNNVTVIPVFTGMTVVVVYRSNLQKIVRHATLGAEPEPGLGKGCDVIADA